MPPIVFETSEGSIASDTDWLPAEQVITLAEKIDNDYIFNEWLIEPQRMFPVVPVVPKVNGPASFLNGNEVAYGKGFADASDIDLHEHLRYIESSVWIENQPLPIATQQSKYFRTTIVQTGPMPPDPLIEIDTEYLAELATFTTEPGKQFSAPMLFGTTMGLPYGGIEQKWVSLLDLRFEDEEPYSGLDDVTPGVPWLMVPLDEENRVVALRGSGVADFDLETLPPGSTISLDPSIIDESPEELAFVGDEVGEDESMVASAAGSSEAYPVLRFAVYTPREIDLTVHMVSRLVPEPVPAGDVHLVAPDNDLEEAEIEDHLNRIYKNQANLKFNVTVNHANVDWDVSTADDLGITDDYAISPRNHHFDFLDEPNISSEEAAILNAAPLSVGINVYVVGGAWNLDLHRNLSTGVHISRGSFRGWAKYDSAYCWIQSTNHPEWKRRSDIEVLDTIAHEIGHVFMGGGHADEPESEYSCFVQGTNYAIRLMASGDGQEDEIEHRTLLKCEWDKISEWFDNL